MPNQNKLAARAAGKPAHLKMVAVIGDGDTTIPCAGVEFGDVIVGVAEFYSPDEGTNTAIAGVQGATVTGNGTITLGGSAIAPDHSALVFYFDFDA